ncbi:hypothetical protein [Paenibacillus mesotrionivorans]|uniref:Uncharacterized protein n=1 Tax=Paenibacillus mesotrionivorans TaxID=3160968 RepID=A0ACC7NWG6_9BACL
MTPALKDIIRFLGAEEWASDKNQYSLHITKGIIYKRSYLEFEEEGNKEVGTINEATLKQVVKFIEEAEGNVSPESSEISLQKVIGPYLFMINYPPTAIEYCLTVNKLGPDVLPWKEVADLWSNRIPFVANKKEIRFYKSGKIIVLPFNNEKRALYYLQRAFRRNAYLLNSYEGIHEDDLKLTEILTLVNGDIVIIRYDGGAVEIQYLQTR